MIRVVLDTNILVSGTLYIGKPKRVIDLAFNSKIQLIASAETIDEFKEVIRRSKFKLSNAEQEKAVDLIIRLVHTVEVRSKFKVVRNDPKDDKFIEVAYDGKAEYIVSGDHHLLDLKEFSGIRIVKASEMLELID